MNCFELFELLDVFDPINRNRILAKLNDPTKVEERDFKIDYCGYKVTGNTSNLIDKSLYFLGSYEPNIQTVIKSVLQSHQGSDFLDIGANFGLHSLFASQYARTVFAVEPLSGVRERMVKLIEQKPDSNIQVFPLALSDQNSCQKFFLPKLTNLGTGSFIFDARFHDADNYVMQETISLESFLQNKALKQIALIKLDVEGHEAELLQVLSQLMTEHQAYLIFENSPTTHKKIALNSALKHYLSEHFVLYYFKNSTDPSCPLLKWDFDWYGNIFAVPKMYQDQFVLQL